jgi:single-strand DNA-binding protein
MALSINRIELTGNLGSAPELRTTANGVLVATVSIAVRSSYKVGEAWQERTDWFRLVAFGERAEHLGHFAKGARISVTGRLQANSFTDHTGQRRTSVEVVVLHAEAAPLTRKAAEVAEERQPEAELPPQADETPVAPEETPKPRRRRKTAA